MNRNGFARNHPLLREEQPREHLSKFYTVTHSFVSVNLKRLLRDPLRFLHVDGPTFHYPLDPLLSLVLRGLKPLLGYFEISPRNVDFFFIREMKDNIPTFAATLRIEFYSADWRILYRKFVDAEGFEILTFQATNQAYSARSFLRLLKSAVRKSDMS